MRRRWSNKRWNKHQRVHRMTILGNVLFFIRFKHGLILLIRIIFGTGSLIRRWPVRLKVMVHFLTLTVSISQWWLMIFHTWLSGPKATFHPPMNSKFTHNGTLFQLWSVRCFRFGRSILSSILLGFWTGRTMFRLTFGQSTTAFQVKACLSNTITKQNVELCLKSGYSHCAHVSSTVSKSGVPQNRTNCWHPCSGLSGDENQLWTVSTGNGWIRLWIRLFFFCSKASICVYIDLVWSRFSLGDSRDTRHLRWSRRHCFIHLCRSHSISVLFKSKYSLFETGRWQISVPTLFCYLQERVVEGKILQFSSRQLVFGTVRSNGSHRARKISPWKPGKSNNAGCLHEVRRSPSSRDSLLREREKISFSSYRKWLRSTE